MIEKLLQPLIDQDSESTYIHIPVNDELAKKINEIIDYLNDSNKQ